MQYTQQDLVRIAKREHNTKRNYLVVDPLQGKHVPVSPVRALRLFTDLAEQIKDAYPGEKLLLVGFAETATAIGAQAAITLGVPYIQTTRERISGVDYLFFSESHSHATEQKLVKDDMDRIVPEVDRIVFVEDEVTTGNTILHIIDLLQETYKKPLRFAVLSLLNGMTKAYADIYEKRQIDRYYLVKTDHSSYGQTAEQFAGDGVYHEVSPAAGQAAVTEIPVFEVGGLINTRRLTNAGAYKAACETLAETVISRIKPQAGQRILVLGTEEFMYPALYTGSRIEALDCKVNCHATTRSPIAVSCEADYPLHTRYALRSLYDTERRTFLYDLFAYDQVVILTDAPLQERDGLQDLLAALKQAGNETITVVRWC